MSRHNVQGSIAAAIRLVLQKFSDAALPGVNIYSQQEKRVLEPLGFSPGARYDGVIAPGLRCRSLRTKQGLVAEAGTKLPACGSFISMEEMTRVIAIRSRRLYRRAALSVRGRVRPATTFPRDAPDLSQGTRAGRLHAHSILRRFRQARTTGRAHRRPRNSAGGARPSSFVEKRLPRPVRAFPERAGISGRSAREHSTDAPASSRILLRLFEVKLEAEEHPH